jgi:hypothetical protein
MATENRTYDLSEKIIEEIKKKIEEWKSNCIIEYNDDCPFCERHKANVVIFADKLDKEIIKILGEIKI